MQLRALALLALAATAAPVAKADTPLCGQVTVNTAVCIAADRSEAWISSRAAGQVASFYVTASPSASWSGATAYVGVANLSFIQGFGPGTSVALVVDEGTEEARLLYRSTIGWTAWPGSGQFQMSNYVAIPAAAGVSN